MVRRLPTVIAVAVVAGALAACSGPNPATHFCEDYGEAVGKLYVDAANYEAAPAEFSATAAAAMDDLSRLRAPDDQLRRALDSARFALTVFSEDASLADFLSRTDFAQDDVVKSCAEHGVELKPAAG
ncbi:hypothetical protein [Actinophytocola sp.]|uniref:hypothetical protein n=1 Tax=Actinophytocola sp. TaxID=1872138 RepID=UPI002D2A41BF|nr:hypothetical protein [Actinophytocola sp.]HYQ69604.1 hypothetical protein [Actinophytocola sp.]